MPIIEGVSNSVLASSVVIGAVFAGLSYQCYCHIKRVLYPNISVDELLSTQNEPPPAHNTHMCPVCRSSPTFAIETNCAHLYCGTCIKTCYDRKPLGSPKGLLCPLCRQEVTLLFMCFSQEERFDVEFDSERAPLCAFIWNYNTMMNEERTWLSTLREVPLLLRRLLHEVFDNTMDYQFTYRLYILFFLLVAYVLIPLDAVPESVFGIIGLIDDLLVVGFMCIYISSVYRQHLAGPQ